MSSMGVDSPPPGGLRREFLTVPPLRAASISSSLTPSWISIW